MMCDYYLARDRRQARRQMEEEAEAKNSIIKQLEDEKRKIEADVASLKVLTQAE